MHSEAAPLTHDGAASRPKRHLAPVAVLAAIALSAVALRSRAGQAAAASGSSRAAALTADALPSPAAAGVVPAPPAELASMVGDDDDAYSYSYFVSLLDGASGSLTLGSVEYAQCFTGFCTKNGDGETASCGCLSMRPSDANAPTLSMGWAAATLVASPYYREAVRLASDGDTDEATTLIEGVINDGTLFDGYSFVAGTPTRVSLHSTDNPYFSSSGDVETCTDYSFAQCAGAPCFDVAYSGVWNITCICPYVNMSSASIFDSRADACSSAAEGGGCAAVGFGATTEYSASGLEAMLTALSAADADPDQSGCPSDVTGFDD